MYYLGLLLTLLCSTSVLAAIPYSEKDASIVAGYGSENGAFLVTAGDLLQFYWSAWDGTIENCTAPSSFAVSTVMYDTEVAGDNLSILLLSNNRLYIVTFVVTASTQEGRHVCTGSQDWTDKTMLGKPMSAYFLPSSSDQGNQKLFAYSDTKRNITIASYSRVSGQISVGWTRSQSLITVDSQVSIEDGPVNDYAVPAFFYDNVQDAVVYLDKSGKVYVSDLTLIRSNPVTLVNFTQIAFDPSPLGVTVVSSFRLDPVLKAFMIQVGTGTCAQAVVLVSYNPKSITPSAPVFTTIGVNCLATAPSSDALNFYYQYLNQLYRVQGTAPTLFFTGADGTIIYDYAFYGVGEAVVITKNPTTFSCTIYLVEGGQATSFGTIPFLTSELVDWKIVYESNGALRGVLFWTNVATVYGYGFGDDNYEVTLALDNPKEFTVVTLQSVDGGINSSKSYMAVSEGSEEAVEFLLTLFWDYSNLALPITNDTTKPAFYFPDFIIALTRVKNDVTAIFNSYLDLGDVASIETWSPTEWQPYPDGLTLAVTFNQGETDDKITTILTNIANEIGVTVERECEFQDFLSCDVLSLWPVYTPDNPTTTTVGTVTFYVNAVSTSLPSVLALLVTVLYTLVSL